MSADAPPPAPPPDPIEALRAELRALVDVCARLAVMNATLLSILRHRGVLNELEARVIFGSASEVGKDPALPRVPGEILEWAAKGMRSKPQARGTRPGD